MKPINIKRLIGALLCLTMILSGTVMAFAAELDEPVTEDPVDEYQYGYSPKAYLSISNGTASFYASIKGYKDVATKLTGTIYLQRYSGGKWTNVKSTEGSTNSLSLTISCTKGNCANGTYRTHAVFKVYSGANYETITVNSSSVKYTK